MIEWLTEFFGEYTPVMSDVYDVASDTVYQVVASGAAGVDWPYIARVVVFCIVLWCFFRTLGGLLCRS